MKVETTSKNHIDCIIGKGREGIWRFTGFYGEPNAQKRHESQDLLRQLNSQNSLPWLCLGDFNEILREEEKKGGNNRGHAQMQLFRDVIDECGFIDMGFKGYLFFFVFQKQGFYMGETRQKFC